MKPNGWLIRFITLAVFAWCTAIHAVLSSGVPNTPAGMLMYHGSAAMVDYFLALYCACALTSLLCRDMQVLCLVSMIINFAGWLMYVMYVSPAYYDGAILILNIVQIIRLFSGGDYVDYSGKSMVRGGYNSGCENSAEQ